MTRDDDAHVTDPGLHVDVDIHEMIHLRDLDLGIEEEGRDHEIVAVGQGPDHKIATEIEKEESEREIAEAVAYRRSWRTISVFVQPLFGLDILASTRKKMN